MKYLLKLSNRKSTKYKIIDKYLDPEWIDSEIYQAALDFYYTECNPTARLEAVNYHNRYMIFVQEEKAFGVNWDIWKVDMVERLLTYKNPTIRLAAKEYLSKL